MQFCAVSTHCPSLTGPHSAEHSSSYLRTQTMYSYSNFPSKRQQQSQDLQQVSKVSQSHPTWAVPQTHNPYHTTPRGSIMGSKEESERLLSRIDVMPSQSPASSCAAYSDNMSGIEPYPATDYFAGVIDTSPWGQKVCEELEAFPSIDSDVIDYNHGLMGQDENTPIIDLRQYPGMGQQEPGMRMDLNPHSARRTSESSFSISSTGGGLPDTTTYDELASSEAIAFAAKYDAWSYSEMTPSHLQSPLASPCRPQYDGVVRAGTRARASPAPHHNVRLSPYTLDSSRAKRWSTGHAPTSTPTSSHTMTHVPDRFAPYGPRLNPHHSMPAYTSNTYSNLLTPAQNVLYPQSHPLHGNNRTLFMPQDQPRHLEVPRPLPSQGLFRLLQSNTDRYEGSSSHFADLSDPPDLYSSLHGDALNPPETDMNPSDPDLVPHEQDLRFIGDLYTPRWVRGHGNKREGWCGLCKPGRWLVLKNSAFWYDKSFTHGVSAATGAAFQGPHDTRRTEGNMDVWEGLCGSCNEWIALVSSKKKGTTWFRHAYKCHTHPKVKDGPKRRRETQAARGRAVSTASTTLSSISVKQEPQQVDAATHRHSTPSSVACDTLMQSYGTPNPSSYEPFLNSITPATRQSSNLFHPNNTSYPVPTSAVQPMHSLRAAPNTPLTASYVESTTKQVPVVGMFPTPLQSLSNFSSSHVPSSSSAHQVSEPELVGIKTSTTALDSIANML